MQLFLFLIICTSAASRAARCPLPHSSLIPLFGMRGGSLTEMGEKGPRNEGRKNKLPKRKKEAVDTGTSRFKKLDNPNSCLVQERDDITERQSVVYMNPTQMKDLTLLDGDIVLIKARQKRDAVGIVKSNSSLMGNMIQVTKLLRSNLRTRQGQSVQVSAFPDIKIAKSVQFTPYKDSLYGRISDLFDDFLKPFFVDKYAPLKLGQTIACERSVSTNSNLKIRPKVEFKVTAVETFEEEESIVEGVGSGDQIRNKKKDDYCVIGPDTEIIVDSESLDRNDDENPYDVTYDDIGGCDKQLSQIREVLELPLRHPELFRTLGISPPKGVLMHGPPGTGKTMIARAVAAESGAYMYLINGPEIMSKMAGESESNLRNAFAEAEKNSPAIIFIDEIDSIATKRDKTGGEVEKRVVSQLLTLMDGIKQSSNIVVLAATNRPNVLDPALRRFGRFDREIDISIPDEHDRLEILRVKTKKMKLANSCDLEAIAKATHGYVGADLAQLCMEGAFQAIRENIPWINIDDDIPQYILDSIAVNQTHLMHGLAVTNPSALRENIVEVPDVTWDDVGGLEDVKRELYETIQYPVEHQEKFRKFGMEPSKGVLLYGPPGTGKTLLAKAIANECGANFISIKGPELLTMWFGESEANVRNLFEKARSSAPCILFFDEIDSIAKARGSGFGGGSDAGDRVINQILTEIDGVSARKSVFVIGATNRPDILDPAVTRPGRFDQLIYIPMPDLDARLGIFRANLRKSPVAPDVDLLSLANATEGFSGADINEVCQRAARNAVIELAQFEKIRQENLDSDDKADDPVPFIRKDHFEEALGRSRKSISEEDVRQYEAYRSRMKAEASMDTSDEDEAMLMGNESSSSQ